jgi:transcriptional regulator with XRE-family HTH domain
MATGVHRVEGAAEFVPPGALHYSRKRNVRAIAMDVGARLRHAREEKGLTLEGLSRVTRVSLPILYAIEQNNRSAIPPRPYGRGFVRIYASEVGLEPEQAVRDFFSQFAPSPEPPPAPVETSTSQALRHLTDQRSPQPVALMLTWGLAAALAVAIGGWGLPRTEAPEAVGVSGHSTPGATGTLGRAPSPATPAAPVTSGVTISLEATGPSWVTAEVDGQRVIYRTMQPGEREVLRARREIRIRAGNAGALRWQVAGRAATAMGKAGEVRTARITAADARP